MPVELRLKDEDEANGAQCLSREEIPRLAMDFVCTFPDEEEERAQELLDSIGDMGKAWRRER